MFLPSNITLQFGDSGDFVAELQRRLAAVGSHQESAISGFYDGVTVSSVTAFQSRSGLRTDGIAGPETLRRLNGVMSGDTSTTEEKKEEEQSAQQQYEQMRQDMLVQEHQQHMYQQPVEQYTQQPVYQEVAPTQPAYQEPAPVTAQPSQEQQQFAAAQMMAAEKAAAAQTPQAPNAGDMLAQMLLQAVQTPAASPSPEPRQPAAESQSQAQEAARPSPEAAPTAEAQAPKGIVGRALQKMDAMVQKLAGYFEQKLPPDVLREVQNIGQTMAKSGVRETAIPTGPEPERALATPARGPEQQQGQQRG